jgi:hypothetical protein
MSVKIQPMVCGWLETAAAGILANEPGRLKLPIPSYLIEHPKGRVIFDTGLHRELQRIAAASAHWPRHSPSNFTRVKNWPGGLQHAASIPHASTT